ncbi:MAG: DUF4105 domain-containing protein [Bacteroides sp.]|nr:DUF4105 domain-containing protein [Bacteroides sp.]
MYKYFLLFIFFFFSLSHSLSGRELNPHPVQVSLLTCSPGTEVYSLFGHTALRIRIPEQGMDAVFNYGLFSFNSPNFLWRFVKGETDYQLGITTFSRFSLEYETENRSVYEQKLNLQPEEIERLWNYLQTNYLPENRMYRYNFLYDNCSTRPRDVVEYAVEGAFIYPQPAEEHSFRKIVHSYTRKYPWTQFGIDLCLASRADKLLTPHQQMFAPEILMEAFKYAKVERDGTEENLVDETRPVISAATMRADDNFFSPGVVFWGLFFFVTVFTLADIYNKRTFWLADVFFLLLYGVVGAVLCFLNFFSEHPAVSFNYLLFLFNPLYIIWLPVLIKNAVKKKFDLYYPINGLVLTLFIVLWPILPQSFNPAVLPLTLILLLRAISYLFVHHRKNR